jgi:hypothetical protein
MPWFEPRPAFNRTKLGCCGDVIAPGICTPAFLQRFHVNFFAVIAVIAEGGMHRGERQIRIVAHDFLR